MAEAKFVRLLIAMIFCGAGLLIAQVSQAQETASFDATPLESDESLPVDPARDSPQQMQRGVWTYDIDLDFPPTGQLAKPTLQLHGGHRLPDGLLGLNWQLELASDILRRGATGGVPTRTESDTFWLGSVQLYLTATRADGAQEYRLEQDDNRVFLYDPKSDYWQVTRNGWNWTYGDAPGLDAANASEVYRRSPTDGPVCRANTVVKPGGKVLTWHLRRAEDPFGNPVDYSYGDDCSCHEGGGGRYACPHLPTEIHYDQATIRFDYESRADSRVTVRDGVPRILNQRLTELSSSITKDAETVPYSRYRFKYADQPRSLVSSIEQIAADGTARQLIEASYSLAQTGFAVAQTLEGFADIEAESKSVYVVPHVVNFDGDGFPDLVLLDDAEDGVDGPFGFGRGYRNKGDGTIGFEPDPALTAMLVAALGPFGADAIAAGQELPAKRFNPGAYVFADTNGDGRTELHTAEGVWVYDDAQGYIKATPAMGYPEGTFLHPGIPDPEIRGSGDLVADIDGDALPDLVSSQAPRQWSRGNGEDAEMAMPVQLGTSFATNIERVKDAACGGDGVLRTDLPNSPSFGLPTYDRPDEYWDSQASFADVNGDAITDLIYAFPNCFDPDPASDLAVWSRVFLGKGDGTFFSSDLMAGPGFIQHNSPADVGNPESEEYPFLDWKGFSVADFDGDGAVEFVHRPEGQSRLYAAHFLNAKDGWATGADSTATIPLPNPVHALSTYVRTGWRPEPCECLLHQISLIADWNGDSFSDILLWERPAKDPDTPINAPPRHYKVRAFANTRTAPHYAITAITNQWGGKTEVSYQGSALNGENDRLGSSIPVVSAVTDDRGRSEYHYSGGMVEAGRFLGFAEVEAAYENGFAFSATFSLSRPFLGQMVSRVERGAAGAAIDRYLHYIFVPADRFGSVATYDTTPPYFNPVKRQCDFEVGGGASLSKDGALKKPGQKTEADYLAELDAACFGFGQLGPVTLSQSLASIDVALHGWNPGPFGQQKNHGYPSAAEILDKIAVHQAALPLQPTAQKDRRKPKPKPEHRAGVGQTGPLVFSAPLVGPSWQDISHAPVTQTVGYAPNSAATTRLLAQISPTTTISLPRAEPIPTAVLQPKYRLFVKDMTYTAAQNLAQVMDHRNSAVSADWTKISYAYGPYRGKRIQGEELTQKTVTYLAGTALTTIYEKPAAFGVPTVVTQIGSDQTRRSTHLRYGPKGYLTRKSQDIDLSGATAVETYAYGDCGQTTEVRDAAGRLLRQSYGADCRQISSTFAGGSVSYQRDGFGRVTQISHNDGVFAPVLRRFSFDDHFATALAQPKEATLFGALAEFTYRDLWGRPIATKICTLPDTQASPLPGPAQLACQPGDESWRVKAWANDGSPRLAVSEFKPGEKPYMAVTYYDARGRLSHKVEPNRAHLEQPSDLLAGFPLAGADGTIDTLFTHELGAKTITKPGGETCTENFDTLYREVTCAGRLETHYDLDAFGHKLATTDANGLRTEYSYDGFFNLAREQTLADLETCDGTESDPFVDYTYDLRGLKTSMTTKAGVQVNWAYDPIGRLTQHDITPGNGDPVIAAGRWVYHDHTAPAAGTTIVETDVNGNRIERQTDSFGQTYRSALPDGRAVSTSRDDLGRVTSLTAYDGLTTHFDYDSRGRTVREYLLIPANEAASCRLTDGAGACRVGVETSYDGAGRPIRQIDADGVPTRFRYNRHGQLTLQASGPWLMQASLYNDDGTAAWEWAGGSFTSYGYDAWKNPVSVCEGSDLAGNCEARRDLEWTPTGQISAETLDGLWRSAYSYDQIGRLVETLNPDGSNITYTHGLATPVCRVVDESGLTTSISYDPLSRMTAYQPPEYSAPRRYSYQFGLAMGDGTFGSQTIVTEPDGGLWTTQYDFANRAQAEIRPDQTELRRSYTDGKLAAVTLLSAEGVELEHMRFGYNGLGLLAWEAGPDLNPGPGPQGYAFQMQYSDAGRLLAELGPESPDTQAPILAQRRSYGAFGLLDAEIQEGVTTKRYAYDVAARFPRVATVRTGLDPAAQRTKRYSYSTGGTRLVAVEQTGLASPDMAETEQTLRSEFSDFDSYGRPRSIIETDARDGQTTRLAAMTLETDARGQPTLLRQTVLSDPEQQVTFSYTPNGSPRRVEIVGQGASAYTYDAKGLLKRIQSFDTGGAKGGKALIFALRDAFGRPVSVQLPDGGMVDSTYDLMGRLVDETLTLPGGATRTTQMLFDPRGLLTEQKITTNATTLRSLYNYTPEAWIAEETRLDAAGQPSERRSYSYDPAGNRISMTDLAGATTKYGYGSLDPTTETGDVLLSVTDAAGDHLLAWDGFGGMLRDQRGFGFGRDVAGRDATLWTPDGYLAARITRDSSDRPVKIEVGAKSRSHIWANPFSDVYPLATIDSDGQNHSYTAFGSRLYGTIKSGRFATAVSDQSGTLQNDGRRFIDPSSAFGQGIAPPASGLTFVFAGQELIENTPFLSAQERIYDPETGLFASTDPLGALGPRHRFRYAGNAPTAMIDPWGTDAAGDFTDLEDGGGDTSSAEIAPETITMDDDSKLNFTGQDVVALTGWSTEGGDVVSPEGVHYPIDESQVVSLETTAGDFYSIIAHFFYDENNEYQFVGFGYQENPGTDDTAPTADAGRGPDPAADTEVVNLSDDPEGISGGAGDPVTNDLAADLEGGAGEEDIFVPSNFTGTAAEWAAREAEGFTIDDHGLATTPGGSVVIMGMNDNLNPLPDKVLVNIGADAIDGLITGNPLALAAQATGYMDPDYSPANKAIQDAGWGYTASEKGREWIAETSASMAASVITAPIAAAAEARATSIMARGCEGPLARLPAAARVLLNVECFAADTLVATPDGPRRIDAILPGDAVFCEDTETGQQRSCPVQAVLVTPNRAFMDLHVDTGTQQDHLYVTANHRFFVEGFGWQETRNLNPGDLIRSDAPGRVTVVEVSKSSTGGMAYNLEVDGLHNYFAGKLALLTHNGGPAGTCPATTIGSRKELAQLLGRAEASASTVTVGEVKGLLADGKITQTALGKYLRGDSRARRAEILRKAIQTGRSIAGRASDSITAVPLSEARNGNLWNLGHVGTPLRDLIIAADPSQTVQEFRAFHWSKTMMEQAAENISRGAGITPLDPVMQYLNTH